VEADTRNKVQIVFAVLIAIAVIRVGWIFYQRHEDAIVPVKKEVALNPDYYVTPKKIYAYDMKTAKKELIGQQAWAKVGYYYPYYAYDAATHRADLAHEIAKLGPLEKLDITDVFQQPTPGGERRVLVVFERDGKKYATAIGNEKDGDYKFYCNEMLFYEDPHQLYKHWPADVWQAIDQHQVKPGMSELQADFAIGVGLLESGGDENDRTFDYPNGGKPLDVSYHNGKAVDVKPGKKE